MGSLNQKHQLGGGGVSLLPLCVASFTGMGLVYLVSTGVGVWGNNNPVNWGWAIVNFVFWIGIGHAGTLISAVLCLLKAEMEDIYQPSIRSHDGVRCFVCRDFPSFSCGQGLVCMVAFSHSPIQTLFGLSLEARWSGMFLPYPPMPRFRFSFGIWG